MVSSDEDSQCAGKNRVEIGIGGWQSWRDGVKVGRERQTTIMTVTDCVEMGMGNAAKRALEVVWDGADAVWLSFDVDYVDTAFVLCLEAAGRVICNFLACHVRSGHLPSRKMP